MNMIQALVIGLGLTVSAQILSALAGIVFGGFKVGKLQRSVVVTVPALELEAFLTRLLSRLSELGFREGDQSQEFIQSGATFGDLTSFTHAKTKKKLSYSITEEQNQAQVSLNVQYLDTIVGDTGETAYADAVLDFVTGTTDAMNVVPNRSNMAFTTLVAGVLAMAAAVALPRFQLEPVAVILGMLVFIGVNLTSGAIAIVIILATPRELCGTREAVIGMVLSVVGLVIAVFSVVGRL